MLFKKKNAQENVQEPRQIVGFTKSKRILFFKIRSKPIYAPASSTVLKPATGFSQAQPTQEKKQGMLANYFLKVGLKHKNLEAALASVGIRENVFDFIRRMFINALIVAIAVGIAFIALLLHYGLGITGIILGGVLGYATYVVVFERFLQFPVQKSRQLGKGVERDILFAARDLVVSLRSGMPLFNAIVAVSTGYGDASKEFAKIVELVQLGMPIEQAIDKVSSESQSRTFKRIMLQASISIKSGADIVNALQGVVEDVTQERVIELRRYGQRLNALAMFYMLFGVIFPSMGIAVATILTTFINIFSITPTVLLFTLVGIFFLQLIFLNIMRSSRPVFSL